VAVAEAAAATRANIASDAAGQNNGADARDRPNSRFGKQGRGGFHTVLASAPHSRGDQPGNYRGGEGRAAPLRHSIEFSDLILIRIFLASVWTCRIGVDEVPAGCVHVYPAAVIAEGRAIAAVGRERADGDHMWEGGRPGWPLGVIVASRNYANNALVLAEEPEPPLKGQQRSALVGAVTDRLKMSTPSGSARLS